MADELGAELSLDLDAARREIESFRRDVEDELDRAVRTFADSYEDTVNRLPTIEPEIESQIVTDELNRAIAAADTELAVETDGAAITSDINEAVGATEAVVQVDTGPMTAEIIDAVESTHPTIEPEIDTAAARASLEDLAQAFESGEVEGTALSTADFRAQELADSLSDVTDAGNETRDTLGAVSNVSTTTATAFSAARGDGSKLFSLIGQMNPSMKALAGTTLGVAAGFTALFQAGQANVASFERANQVLGQSADLIERIDVGGLSGDLGDLAARAGSSDNALRNAASSASQMGLASGKSTAEVADFANKVSALALRAVAMNPALGDAGNVAERLNTVLARGGRFLNRYGLDLTAAEITLRALADTGKTSVADLTLFERSVAGADIAVEKLGASIGRDFETGTQQATLRLRALKTAIGDAFAEAGAPLIAPTIEGLESLAEASTGVSEILGQIGRTVIPPIAAGMESLGGTASTAAEALGLIPSEVLAIAAGLLVLDRATGRSIRSFGDLRAGAALAMETVAGRSVAALGAMVALDQGLQALGTSTEELGVQFITTGAAIGFAFGGPGGALAGGLIGGIAQAVTAESDLARATREIDEAFRVAEQSSEGLGEALFAGADTAVGLAAAISGLDLRLADFIRTAGAFKTLKVDDDLDALGLSAYETAQLITEGEAGLARFIARAQDAGKVTVDLGAFFAQTAADIADIPPLTDEMARSISRAADSGEDLEGLNGIVNAVRARLDDLGLSANLTGEEFAALSNAQQRQVLIALRQAGANTDLIAAFRATQRQVREAAKAQFEAFVESNRLSPALADVARNISRVRGEGIDWERALRFVNDAVVGILPTLGLLGDQAGRLQREFNAIGTAVDGAATRIPSFGSALERAFGASTFTLDGNDFLNFDLVGDNIATQTAEIQTFFENVRTIAEQGASNVAAALLQLGPDNLGARVAADLAANQAQFREGLETAFEGFSQAQLFGESLLNTMRSRINFLASTIGGDLQSQLQTQFGTVDLSQISTPQLVAFVERFGDYGSEALRELVDNFNREMQARKLAGIDTTPITNSVAEARGLLTGEVRGMTDDIDVELQRTQAVIQNRVPPAVGIFPKAIEDIQPEVIAALSQIGQIVTTGGEKSAEAWDREFQQIVALTEGTLGRTAITVENGAITLTDVTTGAIITAIDNADEGAYQHAVTLGNSVTQGVAAGIAGAHEANIAMAEMIRDAIDYGYDAAGAQSPAKRFIPLGESLEQGVALGIRLSDDTNREMEALMDRLAAPQPPANVQPVVNVKVDPSALIPHQDSSINFGDIYNYGPDMDSRGMATMRRLRDVQHLRGY